MLVLVKWFTCHFHLRTTCLLLHDIYMNIMQINTSECTIKYVCNTYVHILFYCYRFKNFMRTSISMHSFVGTLLNKQITTEKFMTFIKLLLCVNATAISSMNVSMCCCICVIWFKLAYSKHTATLYFIYVSNFFVQNFNFSHCSHNYYTYL